MNDCGSVIPRIDPHVTEDDEVAACRRIDHHQGDHLCETAKVGWVSWCYLRPGECMDCEEAALECECYEYYQVSSEEADAILRNDFKG